MKLKTNLAILLLWACNANATTVAIPPPPTLSSQVQFVAPPPLPKLDFSSGIGVGEFTKIILADILKVPYVLSPSILALDTQIGVKPHSLNAKTAELVLTEILTSQNHKIRKIGKIWFIDPVPPPPAPVAVDPATLRTWTTYKPKHRPVSYFAEVLPPVFPEVKFSFQKDGLSEAFLANATALERKELATLMPVLDVPLAQVSVRALLLEYSSDERDGSGVDLALDLLSSKLKISLTSAIPGNSALFKTPSITAVLSAFDADSRFNFVAAPTITMQSGVSGKFQYGSSIPYLSTTTTAQNGEKTQSVAQLATGVLLTLQNRIVGETISLNLDVSINDASDTSTGVGSLPVVFTRTMTSSVVLQNKELFIIGGMRKSTKRESTNKLFGIKLGSQSQEQSSEFIIILFPELISAT